MAKKFREDELKTTSGLWMSTLFYGGFEVSAQDPHWYVVMADIATIQSWGEKEFQKLVDEGLTNNPYYRERAVV